MRPSDRRRAVTRAALLAALDGELRHAPLDRISVDRIAVAAGVSVGSVYVHFQGKDRMALVLACSSIADEAAELRLTSHAMTPLERVAALGDLLALAATRTPAAIHLLLEPATTYRALIVSSDPVAPTAKAVQNLLGGLDDDLRAAWARPRLALAHEPGAMGAALLASWVGLLLLHRPPGRASATAAMPTAAWAALKDALLAAR